MATPNFQPTSLYLDSVQALLDWKPGGQPFDPFNVALVPLQPRPVPAQAARLMDCNDFKGGYVANANMWPQGSADADTYSFSFWQYVDSFCYFSHHRITIPTTWWINAAHQNGVPVIGTVIFESGSDADLTLMFSTTKGQPNQAVAQLAAIAKYYGFEGWFFNVENGLTPDVTVANITDFMTRLSAQTSMVIWYDSVTKDGVVSYQNCLNDKNNVFFVASSGIFTNYGMDAAGDDIKTSVSTAQGDKRPSTDVYTGVDVWDHSTPGRGWTFYNAGPPSCQAVGMAVNGQTSVGLFAPGWTFETAPGTGEEQYQNFLAQDRTFWIGDPVGVSGEYVAKYISARAVPLALPFYTNFDRGRGLMFAVRGQLTPTQQWSNLSLEGQQPTYQFKATAGKATAFAASFNQQTAYDGGACLQVQGQGAGAQDSVTYELFDFTTAISGAFTVNAVFQPMVAGAPFPGVALQLVFADGTSVTTTAKAQPSGGWYFLSQAFDGSYAGKTLTQLCLQVGPSFDGQPPASGYGVLIGALSIWNGTAAAAPAPVQNLQGWLAGSAGSSAQQAYLTWQYPAGAARFYDIWQIGAGGTPQWLVRVCANAAWLANVVPAAGASTVTLGVQPVSYALVAQPPTQMATVTVDVSGASFNDTGMALMSGSPITQMVVRSGDVLNAIQATNGTWTMPQHGGDSGAATSFTLDAGDSIVEVSGYTGTWFGWNCVLQLTLKTKAGKTYGPYGSMAHATSQVAFSYTAPQGQALLAFYGTTVNVPLADGSRTDIIASLGVSYAKTP